MYRARIRITVTHRLSIAAYTESTVPPSIGYASNDSCIIELRPHHTPTIHCKRCHHTPDSQTTQPSSNQCHSGVRQVTTSVRQSGEPDGEPLHLDGCSSRHAIGWVYGAMLPSHLALGHPCHTALMLQALVRARMLLSAAQWRYLVQWRCPLPGQLLVCC